MSNSTDEIYPLQVRNKKLLESKFEKNNANSTNIFKKLNNQNETSKNDITFMSLNNDLTLTSTSKWSSYSTDTSPTKILSPTCNLNKLSYTDTSSTTILSPKCILSKLSYSTDTSLTKTSSLTCNLSSMNTSITQNKVNKQKVYFNNSNSQMLPDEVNHFWHSSCSSRISSSDSTDTFYKNSIENIYDKNL